MLPSCERSALSRAASNATLRHATSSCRGHNSCSRIALQSRDLLGRGGDRGGSVREDVEQIGVIVRRLRAGGRADSRGIERWLRARAPFLGARRNAAAASARIGRRRVSLRAEGRQRDLGGVSVSVSDAQRWPDCNAAGVSQTIWSGTGERGGSCGRGPLWATTLGNVSRNEHSSRKGLCMCTYKFAKNGRVLGHDVAN